MNENLSKIIYKNLDLIFSDDFVIYWYLDGQNFNEPIKNFDLVSVRRKKDNENFFVIYMENYWGYTPVGDVKRRKSPILSIETEYETKLDSFFSEYIWKKPFIEWIKVKFPELREIKIKTIL